MAHEGNPHAVRWALRMVRNERQFTKWHLASNVNMTVCGLPIRLAAVDLFPEIAEPERVDCANCIKSTVRGAAGE